MMMKVIIITFDDHDDGSRLVAAREGAPGMNYDAWATAQQPAIGILKKTLIVITNIGREGYLVWR